MEAIMKHLNTALAIGEEIVDKNPTACMTKYMKELEAKYGGSRAAWFLLVFFVMIALLFAMGGMALIANVVGFLYPAFASFKAIDSPDAHASAQWLSYWSIFGAFFTFESMCWVIVPAIPYYNMLKMAALVYCFHPYTRGATLVYDTIIRPLVIQHVMPGSAAAKGHKASPAVVAAGSSMASVISSAASGVSGALSGGAGGGTRSVIVQQVADLVASSTNELRVVVISASDIVPTEAPGAGVDCDPYCVLEVLPEGSRMKEGAAENTKYKTVCKTGTANPVWNEGVTIPQVQHLDAKLVVTVCNKRAMGRDQCLGKIEVPLSDEAIRAGPADIVKALSAAEGSEGFATGDLRITVHLH